MAASLDLARQFAESQALAHVGSWEWDLSQPRIWWSDELCRIYGREPGFSPSREEILDALHPEDRPRLEQVIDDGEGSFEYRIVRTDGVVRHVHGRRRAIRDGAGVITHLHGITQDVTARREAELARDEALALMQGAFLRGAVGMAFVAPDGRWLKVNEAMCRLVGWSERELLARTFQDITHPDDVDEDTRQVARALAGEIDEYQMEKRYIARDGAVIWTLLSVALVRDEAGRPRHFVSQVQDISERKRAAGRLRLAEAEARRERDHAQTIIAAMHDGYALTIDSEVITVNEALCEMIGYSEEELVGLRPPYPFWDDEARRIAWDAGARVARTGSASCEVVVTRRDGREIEVEISIRAARSEAGEMVGFVHSWRDVSERNRLQRELERRARTDSLTGLANRYVLKEALAQEARRHSRGQTLALVLLDLDYFKQVNDQHGHPVGDAVLIETARRLRSVIRDGEAFARVGGEEFAWLLPDCDAVGARAAANRARAAIGDRPFDDIGTLTMSAGVAVMEIPCDPDDLYALADRALYDAKQAGRDRTRCRTRAGEALDASGRRLQGPTSDLLRAADACFGVIA